MKKPIIHVYGISYNEEVLMPHFIRHYSSFSEKIFIYDNMSTDKTVQICEQFDSVEVFSFDTNDKIRDDVYLKLKNEIWKKSRQKADLVIVCDIDEFIYSKNFTDILNKSIEEKSTLFKCQGFNMITDVLPSYSDDLFSRFQFGVRESNFDKILMFDPNKIEEINYSFGAHDACPIGKIKFSKQVFSLLHYKFISLDYILARYKLFSSRLSRFNKKLKLGYHYSFSSFKIRNEYNSIRKASINVIEYLI